MRRFQILIGIATAGVLAAGCGGGSKQAEPSAEIDGAGEWEVTVASPLDSVTVSGEEARTRWEDETEAPTPILTEPTVEESRPQGTVAAGGAVTTRVATNTPPPTESFTPGWRVQLFASSAMTNAEELARQARESFSEAVYVEYEAPLYKVRVGDFMTKAAAKTMVTRAQAEGFEAWVVETMVVRPGS